MANKGISDIITFLTFVMWPVYTDGLYLEDCEIKVKLDHYPCARVL